MRKYRFGIWPVAGLPRPFFSWVAFMAEFYDHPIILSISLFCGWTNNARVAKIRALEAMTPTKNPAEALAGDSGETTSPAAIARMLRDNRILPREAAPTKGRFRDGRFILFAQ